MRMSCNGCRVLRKGCSDNCSIRPCLQSIKNPDAQANATLFLAKFYGRAGLTNLITAGPDHLRPSIFRSLLYEACGRIVNPIYGAVGLLCSGNWQHCQDAVEAVLKGVPIVQVSNYAAGNPTQPLKAYDIRHVSRDDHPSSGRDLHKISGCPCFKRSGAKAKPRSSKRCFVRAASHDSFISHPSKPGTGCQPEESVNGHSMGGSEETMEASLVSHGKEVRISESEVELELTLAFKDPQRSRTLSFLARTPPRMPKAVTLHL